MYPTNLKERASNTGFKSKYICSTLKLRDSTSVKVTFVFLLKQCLILETEDTITLKYQSHLGLRQLNFLFNNFNHSKEFLEEYNVDFCLNVFRYI